MYEGTYDRTDRGDNNSNGILLLNNFSIKISNDYQLPLLRATEGQTERGDRRN